MEKKTRINYLQKEKREKLKAEGGEKYQRYLEKQRGHDREYKAKNREKIRERNKGYQRKRRRKLKTENGGQGYKEYLRKRRERENPICQQQRDELHNSYIKTLLIGQGFKKNEILEGEIIQKRKQLKLARKIKVPRRLTTSKQKELILARVAEKKIRREFLEENQLKFCCKCRQPKSFDDFSTCRIKNPSYASICKLCERAINKQKKKTKRLRQRNLFERSVSFR